MSLLEAKPTRATLNRSNLTTSRSDVSVRVRIVSYPQKRSRANAQRIESAVSHVFLLLFLTFMAYGVSSIAGQVMVEQSRKEADRAKSTTLGELRMESTLRTHLLALTNPESVSEWADRHQFTTSFDAKKQTIPAGLLAIKN